MDDVPRSAFTKLYDAYIAQALIVVTSCEIEAVVDKCRAIAAILDGFFG